jgi:hypothetical protein
VRAEINFQVCSTCTDRECTKEYIKKHDWRERTEDCPYGQFVTKYKTVSNVTFIRPLCDDCLKCVDRNTMPETCEKCPNYRRHPIFCNVINRLLACRKEAKVLMAKHEEQAEHHWQEYLQILGLPKESKVRFTPRPGEEKFDALFAMHGANAEAVRTKATEAYHAYDEQSAIAAIYDQWQAAFKVTCNSCYGFKGAKRGFLPNPHIAGTITAEGRRMIYQTRQAIPYTANPHKNPHKNLTKNKPFNFWATCAPETLYGGTPGGEPPTEKKRKYANASHHLIRPDMQGDEVLLYVRFPTIDFNRTVALTVRDIEKTYEETRVIYGDSVTADTPVLVRNPITKEISYCEIADLAHSTRQWTSYHGDKFSNAPFIDGLEAWTERGWTRIKRVIKHTNHKEITRVITGTGCVDVTSDHSLLTPNAQKITPKEAHVGTKLLHCDLPSGMEALPPFSSARSSKKTMAELYYRMFSMGDHVEIDVSTNHPDEYTLVRTKRTKHTRKTAIKIKHLIPLGIVEGDVYDIETENHHFSAGIGCMIVHNTDSVMPRPTIPDAISKWSSSTLTADEEEHVRVNLILGYVSVIAVKAALYCTSLCHKPNNLEFEKIMWPFLLFSAKRYLYVKFKLGQHSGQGYQVNQGVAAKRRDSCNLLRTMYDEVNKIVMQTKISSENAQLATKYIQRMVQKVWNQEIPLEDLQLSAQLKEFEAYDSSKALPKHAWVAKLVETRDPSKKKQVGERAAYVIREAAAAGLKQLQAPGSKKKTQSLTAKADIKVWQLAEDPEHMRQFNIPYNAAFYIEKQLKNPLTDVMTWVLYSDQIVKPEDPEFMQLELSNPYKRRKYLEESGPRRFGVVQTWDEDQRAVPTVNAFDKLNASRHVLMTYEQAFNKTAQLLFAKSTVCKKRQSIETEQAEVALERKRLKTEATDAVEVASKQLTRQSFLTQQMFKRTSITPFITPPLNQEEMATFHMKSFVEVQPVLLKRCLKGIKTLQADTYYAADTLNVWLDAKGKIHSMYYNELRPSLYPLSISHLNLKFADNPLRDSADPLCKYIASLSRGSVQQVCIHITDAMTGEQQGTFERSWIKDAFGTSPLSFEWTCGPTNRRCLHIWIESALNPIIKYMDWIEEHASAIVPRIGKSLNDPDVQSYLQACNNKSVQALCDSRIANRLICILDSAGCIDAMFYE